MVGWINLKINMPSIKFKPLPSDYQELISALRQHIVESEKYAADFEHRHYNGIREKAVIYCLFHAIDLAKGCLYTALEELPDSLTTLSRAILETLFWARYVTLSEETAKEFTDSTINELKRIARKNINAGYARINEKNTNDDRTSEFLNSPLIKDIHKRISIERAAELGGLERVYTNIYGFISMIAHGRAFNLLTELDSSSYIYTSVSVTLGALECIEVITSDWIIHRMQTPRETLTRLLGA